MVFMLKNSTVAQKKKAIAAEYKLLEDPRLDEATKLGFTAHIKQWENTFE